MVKVDHLLYIVRVVILIGHLTNQILRKVTQDAGDSTKIESTQLVVTKSVVHAIYTCLFYYIQ